jgi:hypothetical protein
MTTTTLAQLQLPVPVPVIPQSNLASQIVQNQQIQQIQNQQAVGAALVQDQQRQQLQQQQVLSVGNEFGAYPHLGHLVNELDQNEKSLANLEYDQSKLQSKIAKSKAELARHNSIVESLEERQRFEIGALQGKIRGLKRYIANLEVSKEELRQKLLAANQKAIYGDSQLVAKVEELRGKNQLLKNHNNRLVAKIQQFIAVGGRHPLDLNADGLVDSSELALAAGAIPHPLDLDGNGVLDAAELGLNAHVRHPLDINDDGLVDAGELALGASAVRHPLDINSDGLVDAGELALGSGVLRHPLDLDANGIVDSAELALNDNSVEARLRLQAALNGGAINAAGLTASQRLNIALQSEASDLSVGEKLALADQSNREKALLGASPSLEYLLRHSNRRLRRQLLQNAVSPQLKLSSALGLLPSYVYGNNIEAAAALSSL